MATYVNLFVDQGTDFETTVSISDSKSDAIDISDIELSGQVRRTYTSESSFDFVITKTNTAEGEIEIKLPNETTSQMKLGRYVYDVLAEDTTTGSTFKVVEGLLEIIPSVTR